MLAVSILLPKGSPQQGCWEASLGSMGGTWGTPELCGLGKKMLGSPAISDWDLPAEAQAAISVKVSVSPWEREENEESRQEITSLMGSPLHEGMAWGCRYALAVQGDWHVTRECCISGPKTVTCKCAQQAEPGAQGPISQLLSLAGHVCFSPARYFSGSAVGRKSCSWYRQAPLCSSSSSSSSSCAPCYLIGFVMLERQSPSGLRCALASVISQLASAPQ